MKKELKQLIKRVSITGVFFLFAGYVFGYTPPTALQILWGGTDQTATCHNYGDYITNVTFAGINNTTAGSGPKAWHSDYGRTSPQVDPGQVIIGQTYPFSVTLAATDYAYDYVAVYVDWNQNNVNGAGNPATLDLNENPLLWYTLTGSGTKTLSGNITVPVGTATGQIYLRVMVDADSGGSNGGDLTCAVGYGEIQDYVLTVSAAPTAPTATTGTATNLGTTGATLNGTINPNNASTAVTFEYGLTTSYGTSVTADQSPVTGSSATAVSKTISGLSANTTYHYRVKGVNTGGTTNGLDQPFTTNTGTGTDNTSVTTDLLYPNPITDGFTINAGEKTSLVSIYDINGNLVMEQQAIGKTFINTNALKQGTYIVKVNGLVGKFVKK